MITDGATKLFAYISNKVTVASLMREDQDGCHSNPGRNDNGFVHSDKRSLRNGLILKIM